MEKYQVTGMSCAACQARVEKAVNNVPGVENCAVSLLTNSMGVEGSADPEEIIKAVREAGYGASLEKKERAAKDEDVLADRETPLLKKRLIASLGFLIVLMYFSMGHMMWGWPVPSFFQENHVALGILQMLLAGIIMVINQKFFLSGFNGLLHGSPNMDTLVALGSGVSFLWSTYILFAMSGAQARGDHEAVMKYMMELYFESAAMILTLITVGKMLEAKSKGRTTDALKGLMKLAPKTATVIRDGIEEEIPIEDLKVGDIFLVRPGENIPVDGVVIEGTTAIDESALTGESIPVDVAKGDKVSAATTNLNGFIKCEAIRVGEDTTLSQIIKMVSDAAATKAPIAKIADRVSGIFVPVVIGIAMVTVVVWLLLGKEAGYALARGISVLVISCPCALGLATPVAIMVGNGVGAGNGILFKTSASLEETGKATTVVLDKTGTITKGEPRVTDIIPSLGVEEEKLLALAWALERKSEHPLAKAITSLGMERGIGADDGAYGSPYREISDFRILPGNGLQGRAKSLDGRREVEIAGGNLSFVETKGRVPEELVEEAEALSAEGKTCLYFAEGDRILGVIAVADVLKEESPDAIARLKDMGLKVVMLTGDNERTGKAIGEKAGVDRVIAGVLPEGKEKVVRDLQKDGKVIMVGDGINDAPALTAADMGMAIGAGTDIAMDAADIVLVNSKLSDVPAAIRLSKATLKNIHQNLFWAFFYNVIGIPLAAGVFIKAFGWTLNPMFGAAAMSLSSFFVVTNALRLNLVDIYGGTNRGAEAGGIGKGVENRQTDEKETKVIDMENAKEDKSMKKTMTIEGMMCPHCEATVKKTLEALEGVESAEVSHEKGTAIVSLSEEVSDETLKTAVEEQEYKVIFVE